MSLNNRALSLISLRKDAFSCFVGIFRGGKCFGVNCVLIDKNDMVLYKVGTYHT